MNNIQWRYINLISRTDRLAQIRVEMLRAGIEGTRFIGRVPSDPSGKIGALAYMRSTRPGQVGCYLSHRKLLESWRDAGRTEILGVLEDDAIICDDFRERLAYIAKHLTWSWDIFNLGSCYHCNPPYWHVSDLGRDFEQTAVPHIHRLYGAFGTQGYLINPKSIPKILDLIDRELHRSYAIDHVLILIGKDLDWYGFTPGAIFQRDGYSDASPGINKFSDFLRLCGPYVFTKRLADFDYAGYNWAEGTRR